MLGKNVIAPTTVKSTDECFCIKNHSCLHLIFLKRKTYFLYPIFELWLLVITLIFAHVGITRGKHHVANKHPHFQTLLSCLLVPSPGRLRGRTGGKRESSLVRLHRWFNYWWSWIQILIETHRFKETWLYYRDVFLREEKLISSRKIKSRKSCFKPGTD